MMIPESRMSVAWASAEINMTLTAEELSQIDINVGKVPVASTVLLAYTLTHAISYYTHSPNNTY
jgi:hypothetical protein